MKRIRMTICGIFAVSCIIFLIYIVKTKQLEDHTPPVITCAEDVITVSTSADDTALLKGVTAEDDKDGDITDSVRVSAMTHFIEKGKRTITYIVFDEANQAGTAQRTLVYSDYVSPKIYLSKPLRFLNSTVAKVDIAENFIAEDCLDGDLTNQLRFSMDNTFSWYNVGTYDVTVQVTNSAGDVSAIPMQATIVDSTDREENQKYYPVLSEYIVYTKKDGNLNLKSYITGVQKGNAIYSFEEDAEYLTISKNEINIEHEISYSTPGVYDVVYSYTTENGIKGETVLYVVIEE